MRCDRYFLIQALPNSQSYIFRLLQVAAQSLRFSVLPAPVPL